MGAHEKELTMKCRYRPPSLLFVIISLVLFAASSSAQWSTSSTVNNAVCTATGTKYAPTIISDGFGGTLVMWYDSRGGGSLMIYIQRLNASGARRWGNDGVLVSQVAGSQLRTTIAGDGSGGAIVTWQYGSYPSYSHIYAQRIDSAGVRKWPAAGVPVCTATGDQFNPTIASDNAGGAIIAWRDQRNGPADDVYAQRIDSSGSALWTVDGVAISATTGYQSNPAIVSDDAGGAIITWTDSRNGSNTDIYAQRISALGAALWTSNGVEISVGAEEQSSPMIVGDGIGGAIIAWQDSRNTANYDIYAQRVSASGVVQWAANGTAISTAAGFQYAPAIASDDSGGAIMTWWSYLSGEYDVYARRIDAAGVAQWTPDGVPICTLAASRQDGPTITKDGFGGAYIAWMDYRSGGNPDIYAQRIDASGGIQWPADGVGISTTTGSQSAPTIVHDGISGAIMAWVDTRGIYASRVNSAGALGGTSVAVEETDDRIPGAFALMQNFPNPFNPSTTLSYSLSVSSRVDLRVFDLLGREVAELVNREQHPGTYTVAFDASGLASGMYFYRLTAGDFAQTKKLLLTK